MNRRVLWMCVIVAGCKGGQHEDPGTITTKPVPNAVVAARRDTQRAAAARLAPDPGAAKQILFGDLHVHTTFSLDAFMRTLPFMQGEGAHPPADACDFARYCSDLDFWSINDHSEGLTPAHWQETKESIRQCNAVAGDPKNPDVVAFLGWEWTHVGRTRQEHYGHKNVIFRETAEDRVPVRSISARNDQLAGAFAQRPTLFQQVMFPVLDWANRQRYLDFGQLQNEINTVPVCPEGVPTRDLPADCHEIALTPATLFKKLDEWAFDAMVIPHGNTWGFYTPPGSTFDKQLVGAMHDAKRQGLIEVFSGHGNSEEYRTSTPGYLDDAGTAVCPPPTKDFLPCCWQAGEIIRGRCSEPTSAECEQRVADARRLFVENGVTGFRTIPAATTEQWGDCDQCRDCFLPALSSRFGSSTQYALAISNFDDPAKPRRFRFGFIGSSDNHSARPGTGYKEYGRREMTEAIGPRDQAWRERIFGDAEAASEAALPLDRLRDAQVFQLLDTERQGSFFMTGGLVAVHAPGRDRDAIWGALDRREVYATSGDRILLWFDLLNGSDQGPLPMGSEAALAAPARFRVRAAGSFEQKPGCPDYSVHALGKERLEKLCRGECYYPSDVRRKIDRIEVVRIRPQVRPGEPVRELIEDPWKRIDCPGDRAGCVVEFEDDRFLADNRETIYYVRALQEPTPVVNGGNLRCERDAAGNCTRMKPCFGDYRTPFDDDCLTPVAERAWSSPIFVRPAAAAR